MPVVVHRPLPATEYLAAHPQSGDVVFTFPGGGRLPASRTLLAVASEAFHNMFFGKWKEETEIYLPDSNIEAFETFVNILYTKSIDLATLSLHHLDSLYYLADKYIVVEIKKGVLEAAEEVANTTMGVAYECRFDKMGGGVGGISFLCDIECEPVRAVADKVVVEFLLFDCRLLITEASDFNFLALAYYSGSYDEVVKDAMVKGAVIYMINIVDESFMMNELPETEENSKFLHKVLMEFSKVRPHRLRRRGTPSISFKYESEEKREAGGEGHDSSDSDSGEGESRGDDDVEYEDEDMQEVENEYDGEPLLPSQSLSEDWNEDDMFEEHGYSDDDNEGGGANESEDAEDGGGEVPELIYEYEDV